MKNGCNSVLFQLELADASSGARDGVLSDAFRVGASFSLSESLSESWKKAWRDAWSRASRSKLAGCGTLDAGAKNRSMV